MHIQERQELANDIANMMLAKLGIDPTNQDEMSTLRQDLAFLSRMSRGAREVKSAAIKTCVGALITGTIALFVLGFKDWIVGFFK